MHEAKSAVREALRAVTAWLLSEGVVALILERLFGVTLDMQTRLIMTGFVLAIVRGIDKWLYETQNSASKLLSFDMIK